MSGKFKDVVRLAAAATKTHRLPRQETAPGQRQRRGTGDGEKAGKAALSTKKLLLLLEIFEIGVYRLY